MCPEPVATDARRLARRQFVRHASGSIALAFVAGCGWSIVPPAAAKPHRVGVLVSGGHVTDSGPTSDNSDREKWLAFSDRLQSYGWVEGKTVKLVWRTWYQHEELLSQGISELIDLPVDMLVTENTTATLAAEQRTVSVPIVFSTGGDPVALGLVRSMAHPGANATGVSSNLNNIDVKAVDLLREVVPGLERIAHMSNLSNAANAAGAETAGQAVEQAGMQWLSLDVRNESDPKAAFDAAANWGAQAVVARVGGLVSTEMLSRIIDMAGMYRFPTIYTNRDDDPVRRGGLMAYFEASDESYRRLAYFVDRILRGAMPAGLAVEQVNTFSLAINRAAAAALGLVIPQELSEQVTEWV